MCSVVQGSGRIIRQSGTEGGGVEKGKIGMIKPGKGRIGYEVSTISYPSSWALQLYTELLSLHPQLAGKDWNSPIGQAGKDNGNTIYLFSLFNKINKNYKKLIKGQTDYSLNVSVNHVIHVLQNIQNFIQDQILPNMQFGPHILHCPFPTKYTNYSVRSDFARTMYAILFGFHISKQTQSNPCFQCCTDLNLPVSNSSGYMKDKKVGSLALPNLPVSLLM